MKANVITMNESKQQIAQTEKVFLAQKQAYSNAPLPSAEERIVLLKKLKKAVVDHIDIITAAVSEDFGNRANDETKLLEIIPILEAIKYSIKNVRKWMKPSKRRVGMNMLPGTAWVEYQPLGVVGVISPWNYPMSLALVPIITAITAGNRVMVKMSEYTPCSSTTLQSILKETFPEEQAAIITGDAEVGIAFSKLPFDHLMFTGSTNVGRHIMHAAADNLTPVTLELGGKSPAIISSDYPINHAVERIAYGKCMNVGQTCVSPDYLFCTDAQLEPFITQFTALVKKMYPSMLENNDYTSVINVRQKARLQSYIDDAKEKGTRVIEINPANEDFSNTNKMPISLIINPSDELLVMQDEIFGPILAVKTYEKLDEVLQYINNKPRPLALYYFDYNKNRCRHVSHNTHAGGVCFNETMNHVGVDDLPFGGIGESGMGHYHGHEGFLTFSKSKGIFRRGKINPTVKILPPFNSWFHRFIYKQNLK